MIGHRRAMGTLALPGRCISWPGLFPDRSRGTPCLVIRFFILFSVGGGGGGEAVVGGGGGEMEVSAMYLSEIVSIPHLAPLSETYVVPEEPVSAVVLWRPLHGHSWYCAVLEFSGRVCLCCVVPWCMCVYISVYVCLCICMCLCI